MGSVVGCELLQQPTTSLTSRVHVVCMYMHRIQVGGCVSLSTDTTEREGKKCTISSALRAYTFLFKSHHLRSMCCAFSGIQLPSKATGCIVVGGSLLVL
jgi:hypothetical protein